MASLFSMRTASLLKKSCRSTVSKSLTPRLFSTSTRTKGIFHSSIEHPSSWKNTKWVGRASETFRARFASTKVKEAPLQLPPSEAQAPILAPKSVGIWLLISSTLVYAIIVVGGITRLTESGLSITEWKPITGILPPLSQAEWEADFEKYKATPEFKLMNHQFELEDYKRIFFWEWGHRVLGRVIGIAFVGPLAYFALRKCISKQLAGRFTLLGGLIGAQGALGWYMVKSGLADSLMETPGAVPRVSQYRLASHLGLAFLLYAGMFWSGISIIKENSFVKNGKWMGTTLSTFEEALQKLPVRVFKARATILTLMVFLTALSGAFVAGLDAGLLYNEFPLMGGRLAPPRDELMSRGYAKKADGSDYWWRNIFENPVTVQFDHRFLAITTYVGVSLLFLRGRGLRHVLPPVTVKSMNIAYGMVNVQFLLGIMTLLHLVPVPLAAAHQAGSVALLTAMIHVLISLKRPSTAAQAWRTLWRSAQKAKPAAT